VNRTAALRDAVREQEEREAEPSAAIKDSQSVKTTAIAGERGYDAAKKVTGRKRHILVDVLGLLLEVLVTKANVPERAGAKMLLKRALAHHFERLVLIWADGGYAGQAFCEWVMEHCGWLVEIIKHGADHAPTSRAESRCLPVKVQHDITFKTRSQVGVSGVAGIVGGAFLGQDG